MRVNENAHRLRDLLFREWKLIVILGMSAVIRFRHLGSEIGGSYDFRQAQTAWGVRSLTRGSLNPLDAEVPVLGPPWKLPFEFPLYQWLAAIVGRVLALNELTAARLAAIGFFLLTLLLLHVLVRGILDSQHATLVTVTMSFGAFGLHYGSAILVDFSALAFSLAALIAAHRVLRQWSTLGLAIVAVLAALAHLSKITTSVAWLGLGLGAMMMPLRIDRRRKGLLFLVVWVSVLPYVVWNAWADSVKSKSPASAFLVSGELRTWTFGTIAQRLDLLEWIRRYESIVPSVAGSAAAFTILSLFALMHRRANRLVTVSLVVLIGTPLIFTNLYRHEYYFIALLPALCILATVGVSQVVTMISGTSGMNFRQVQRLSAAALLMITAWSWRGNGYGEQLTQWWYNPAGMNDSYVEAVLNLRENTPDDAVVIVPDTTWDPTFLFLADRRGLILDPQYHSGDEFTVDELGTLYTYVYWFDEANMAVGWEKWGLDATPREMVNERLYRLLPASVDQ